MVNIVSEATDSDSTLLCTCYTYLPISSLPGPFPSGWLKRINHFFYFNTFSDRKLRKTAFKCLPDNHYDWIVEAKADLHPHANVRMTQKEFTTAKKHPCKLNTVSLELKMVPYPKPLSFYFMGEWRNEEHESAEGTYRLHFFAFYGQINTDCKNKPGIKVTQGEHTFKSLWWHGTQHVWSIRGNKR